MPQIYVPVRPRPQVGGYIHRSPQTEQFVEDRIGAEDFEAFRRSSMEIHIPLPILGAGAFLYKGALHPVVAGGAGFTSLSDLINEATVGGKSQYLPFHKIGGTAVANRSSTLWYAAGYPGVGATAAALAGGTNYTRATAGALGPQRNATGGDQLHLIGVEGTTNVLGKGVLLYDRIWAGEPTVTTVGNQTVTMTPLRYATTGASGTSLGNFVFAEVRTTMGAATPTLTMTYVDDQGSAAEAAATVTMISGAVAPTFLYGSATLPNQFIPLNTGDAGVSDITIWAQSASAVSGAYAVVLGHPLMYIPGVAANMGYIRDGINSAFSMQRIYDDACLALLEFPHPSTTATTYTGLITAVSG